MCPADPCGAGSARFARADATGSLIHRVDRALAEFLDLRAASCSKVGPELDTMIETARRFVLDGGKRLRPRFAYWGWRTVLGRDADDDGLVRMAASLELLHGCALVQDDVMDNSATRRGAPAVHAQFAALHRAKRWPGDAGRFGAAAATLIGDLLLAWADTMFATAALPPCTAAATRAAYAQTRELVISGQYLDILVQARGAFSTEDALRVALFKTSTYTVDGPLRLGAVAAGASADVLDALAAYGTAIGEAFQLRDDVLGVFGDPSRTGKPAGDDLREGKRTLLVALAMHAASPEQANLLRNGLGDRGMGADGVAALRDVIIATGALDRVERTIARRSKEARDALGIDAINADARAALVDLAIAATRRTG